MIMANEALPSTLVIYHLAYPTPAGGILGHFRVAVNLERKAFSFENKMPVILALLME